MPRMYKTNTILIAIALVFILALSGCAENKEKAKPVLTLEVAQEGVKRINPEIKVISVGPGPVEGLWELVVKRGTTMSITYMDAEGKLLFLGNVIDTLEKVSLTDLKLNELLKIDPAELPAKGTILLGKADAALNIYVFSDPECPYCALLHSEMIEAVKKREDLAFKIVLVPIIKQHPSAYAKSKTIMCAGSDKEALKLLEDAYTGAELPSPPCDNTVVEDNLEYLDRFSISGTPTIVFQDGTRFQGAIHSEELISAAEKAAGTNAGNAKTSQEKEPVKNK